MIRVPFLVPLAGACAAAVFASAAGAASSLPAMVAAVYQRSVDDGQCQPLDTILTYYNATVVPLSATDTLYVVPCNFGIVNQPARLYIVSSGDHPGVRPLMFAQYDRDFGWIGDDEQFNVAFDAATKTLTAHEYFDPAGDCGSDGTWVWKDYAFALVTYRYQGTCDHTHAFKDWPTVWQLSATGAPRGQIGTVPDFFQSP